MRDVLIFIGFFVVAVLALAYTLTLLEPYPPGCEDLTRRPDEPFDEEW